MSERHVEQPRPQSGSSSAYPRGSQSHESAVTTGSAHPSAAPDVSSPRSAARRGWATPVAAGIIGAVLASAGTYGLVQATEPGPAVVDTRTTADTASGTDGTDGATEATNAALTIDSGAWAQVAERAMPSTVSIAVGSGGQQAGAGSGVVWDTEGHIVTNAHVVAGGDEVEVTLSNGRSYPAEVVGVDAATDLAVLRIDDVPDLTPMPLGDDKDLVVGDDVMAIGNPLGLSGTVTTGIVSALDRPVTTQAAQEDGAPAMSAQPEAVVTNAIQTSAPINPGNSGGALVNADGALVGINSSIASMSAGGGQSGSIGIGFAIPSSKVDDIARQLIEDGTAEHAYLGVGVADAGADLDGATVSGAGVASVEDGTSAAEAGLREGDVITAIDGERVGSAVALIGQVRERSVESAATITYVRDGVEHDVDVTLQTRPDSRP